MLQEYFQFVISFTQSFLINVNHMLGDFGCLLLAGIFLLLLITLKIKWSKVEESLPVAKAIPQKINQHVDSIAGEDVMTTQLDLARAYIEMDENQLAKQILSQVSATGNPTQQRQAQQLMSGL